MFKHLLDLYSFISMSLDMVLDFGDTLNIPQADERNRKVERKEVMLFNKQAFTEAVINAFVHNCWVNGDSPMFTPYEDRIEIVSLGTLPPKQTQEGFFKGVSIPVNKKLSEIFLQLHISEKSGRGVPRIVDEYGKEAFSFGDNAITVAIPFNRLNLGDTPQVAPQVEISKETTIESRIVEFCLDARSFMEIARMLEYSDRKTVHEYLDPLIKQGRITRTLPDKPTSSKQKYITIK